MDPILRLLPAPQPIWVRYGFTILMVALTFSIRLGLEDRIDVYGFILFVPAILASALLFDRGTGLFALGLSTLAVALRLRWDGAADVHLAALAFFLIVGVGLVLVGEGLHKALERAHDAEREKDLLLQEMSHRVKNKFAMIQSIVGLQARQAPEGAREGFDAVSSRVRVIAEVHDYLQMSRHHGKVNMREYLSGLCHSLNSALGHLRPITLNVEAAAVELSPEKALSIGLLANELITNSYKYAFPEERSGTITVTLTAIDGKIVLRTRDDGVGCSEQDRPGLGSRLISILAARLGGNAIWRPGEPGCTVEVEFPYS
jgi:two-component sensor histidine kinase